MTGFFKINRGWREHALFRNEEYSKAEAWLWMIETACYKEREYDVSGRTIILKRGQLCASIRQMADQWKWSKSSVNRFLTRLKTETMIETDIGTRKSVITICNYCKYQDNNNESGTDSGTLSGTKLGQSWDIKEESKKEKNNISSLHSDIDAALKTWSEAAKECGWPKLIKVNQDRKKKLSSRLNEHGLDGFRDALVKAYRSPMIGYDAPSWWSFDWLTKNEGNIIKVLEGNYDKSFNNNRSGKATSKDVDDLLSRENMGGYSQDNNSAGFLQLTSDAD